MLDVGSQTRVADYFVIISALSRPQVKAIYNDGRREAAGMPRSVSP